MRLARGIEQMVAGLPFSPAWQLGANGLWIDPSSNLLVEAIQPIVGAFTLGNNWGVAGGLYTHAAGGGAASITQAILVVGNRYKVSWAITAITAGTITPSVGAAADAAQSTVASFVTELTCTTNTTLGFAASSPCDATIRIDSVENLSLAQVTPMAAVGLQAGSALTQVTAAKQPWKSQTLVAGSQAIQFDGAAANALVSSAALANWNWLHQSSDGYSVYAAFRPTVVTGYHVLWGTAFTDSGSYGALAYWNGATIAHGIYIAGALVQYTAQTGVAINTTHVGSWRCKPLSISSRLNGVAATGPVQVDYSGDSHNCHNTLCVGAHAQANYYLTGQLGDLIICSRYHSSAQVSQIEAYLARKWGVTLP